MAASWASFITTVGVYLDTKTSKTEQQTAAYLASAYRSAILLSTIPFVPGSFILNAPPSTPIENGFLETFNKIKNENKITINSFEPVSSSLVNYWSTVEWSSTPPPPGFASATTGYSTINTGNPSIISSDLMNIFTSPPISSPGGMIFSTKLASVFAKHIGIISGNYNGVTTLGTPGVFPWVGII